MEEDKKMELLCDPKVWEDVLNRVRRKKGRRVDLAAFGTCAETVDRARLVQDISDGRYELQPPRTIYKDKKAEIYLSYKEAAYRNFEDVRTLYAPNNGLDGIVLAVVSQVYNRLYGGLIHPCCRSYRRGVGVKTILHEDLIPRLKNHEHGYKVDLSKYFDSVNRETLDATLKLMDTGSPVDALVYAKWTLAA